MYTGCEEVPLKPLHGYRNVLDNFSASTGRVIAANILPELDGSAGAATGSVPGLDVDSPLKDQSFVDWSSEVICHGLSLSFTNPVEYGVIRSCVRVYSEWLTCLTNHPAPGIPDPVVGAPLKYADNILAHLHHLFTPRKDNNANEGLLRQVKECHDVLRCVDHVARDCRTQLKSELAPRLLKFALSLTDKLLAPVSVNEDLSEQLSVRMMSFTFNIWLWAASIGQFPSPNHWRTFQSRAMTAWRHRAALVEQWVTVLHCLTERILHEMYGRHVSATNRAKDTFVWNLPDLETVLDVWFRIIFLIYRPRDLLTSQVDSDQKDADSSGSRANYKTRVFAKQVLNFYLAVCGMSTLVNRCLGNEHDLRGPEWFLELPSERPRVNALLSLFGDWLLSAAATNPDQYDLSSDSRGSSQASVRSSHSSDEQHQQQQFPTSNSFSNKLLRGGANAALQRYPNTRALLQAGRAEAYSVLCRILCSKKSGEEIQEDLLARIFAALIQAFSKKESEILRSIMIHGQPLFYLDLPAVQALVPHGMTSFYTLLMAASTINSRDNTSDDTTLAQLNHSWLNMIAGVVSYPSMFDFQDSQSLLESMLLKFVRHERDPINVQLGYSLLLLLCFDQQRAPASDIPDKASSSQNIVEGQPANLPTQVAKEICRSLNTQWSSAYAVCFSLIDTLSSLTHLQAMLSLSSAHPPALPLIPLQICGDIVGQLCDFIKRQLERKPSEHSRQLHSLIVAAYLCTCRWLCAIPSLFMQSGVLNAALEVIEMGLTGSLANPNSQTKCIAINPASKRVGDAAEQLLATICAQSLWQEAFPHRPSQTNESLTYFVLDESVLIAVEKHQSNNNNIPNNTAGDTATDVMTIHSGAGSYTCDLELRFIIEQTSQQNTNSNPASQKQHFVPTVRAPQVEEMFPPETEKFLSCKADWSIPSLKCSPEVESLRSAFHEAVQNEKWAATKLENRQPVVARPPSPTKEPGVARLLLATLGGLPRSENHPRRLKMLDSSSQELISDLTSLTSLSTRLPVTGHIFYVRQDLPNVSDILSSGSNFKQTCSAFVRFMSRMGRVTPAKEIFENSEHDGTQTSTKGSTAEGNTSDAAGQLDGNDRLLVWRDWLLELRLVVPSTGTSEVIAAAQAANARDRSQSSPKSSQHAGIDKRDSSQSWSMSKTEHPVKESKSTPVQRQLILTHSTSQDDLRSGDQSVDVDDDNSSVFDFEVNRIQAPQLAHPHSEKQSELNRPKAYSTTSGPDLLSPYTAYIRQKVLGGGRPARKHQPLPVTRRTRGQSWNSDEGRTTPTKEEKRWGGLVASGLAITSLRSRGRRPSQSAFTSPHGSPPTSDGRSMFAGATLSSKARVVASTTDIRGPMVKELKEQFGIPTIMVGSRDAELDQEFMSSVLTLKQSRFFMKQRSTSLRSEPSDSVEGYSAEHDIDAREILNTEPGAEDDLAGPYVSSWARKWASQDIGPEGDNMDSLTRRGKISTVSDVGSKDMVEKHFLDTSLVNRERSNTTVDDDNDDEHDVAPDAHRIDGGATEDVNRFSRQLAGRGFATRWKMKRPSLSTFNTPTATPGGSPKTSTDCGKSIIKTSLFSDRPGRRPPIDWNPRLTQKTFFSSEMNLGRQDGADADPIEGPRTLFDRRESLITSFMRKVTSSGAAFMGASMDNLAVGRKESDGSLSGPCEKKISFEDSMVGRDDERDARLKRDAWDTVEWDSLNTDVHHNDGRGPSDSALYVNIEPSSSTVTESQHDTGGHGLLMKLDKMETFSALTNTRFQEKSARHHGERVGEGSVYDRQEHGMSRVKSCTNIIREEDDDFNDSASGRLNIESQGSLGPYSPSGANRGTSNEKKRFTKSSGQRRSSLAAALNVGKQLLHLEKPSATGRRNSYSPVEPIDSPRSIENKAFESRLKRSLPDQSHQMALHVPDVTQKLSSTSDRVEFVDSSVRFDKGSTNRKHSPCSITEEDDITDGSQRNNPDDFTSRKKSSDSSVMSLPGDPVFFNNHKKSSNINGDVDFGAKATKDFLWNTLEQHHNLALGGISGPQRKFTSASNTPLRGQSPYGTLVRGGKLYADNQSAFPKSARRRPSAIVISEASGINELLVQSDTGSQKTRAFSLASGPHGMSVPCGPVPPPRTKSASTNEKDTSKHQLQQQGHSAVPPGCQQPFAIFIVWLEKFEDYDKVPIDELAKTVLDPSSPMCGMMSDGSGLSCYSSDLPIVVVFIHPIAEGLYRLKKVNYAGGISVSHKSGSGGKTAGPTHVSMPISGDGNTSAGCVVSEDILSFAVRETILNISWRKRLDQEGWVLPQIRRKQKIQEIARRFSLDCLPHEYIYKLITL